MKRSYTRPTTICYEIKVSRSDFLRDDKYWAYLDYCNEFYFVVPPKLVLPSEVPETAGLMVTSTNGTRLYTKKKAPYREVNIPDDLYKYILFSRAEIKGEYEELPRVEWWRRWLENKSARHALGQVVRGRIREHMMELEQEKSDALNLVSKYDWFQKELESIGIDPKNVHRYDIRRELNKALGALPPDFMFSVQSTLNSLTKLVKEIEPSLSNDDSQTHESLAEES